jgi:hypothetical protein
MSTFFSGRFGSEARVEVHGGLPHRHRHQILRDKGHESALARRSKFRHDGLGSIKNEEDEFTLQEAPLKRPGIRR